MAKYQKWTDSLPWKCIDDAVVIRRVENVRMSEVEDSMHNSTTLMISQSIFLRAHWTDWPGLITDLTEPADWSAEEILACIATKLDKTDKKYLDILQCLRGKIRHKFSSHKISEKVVNVNDSIFQAFIPS